MKKHNQSRFTPLLSAALLLVLATTAVADETEDAEYKRFFENKIPAEVDAALDKADEIVLRSINPKHTAKPGFGGASPELDDYPVFGETKLCKEDRKRVVASFRSAAADLAEANKKANGVGGVGCFIPRHALRLKHKEATYDLLICFQCSNVRIYKDGEETEGVGILNRDGKHSKVLNDVLTAAKIELAPLK